MAQIAINKEELTKSAISMLNNLNEAHLLSVLGYLQALVDVQDEEHFTEEEEKEILTSYAQYKNGECEEWKPYQTTK